MTRPSPSPETAHLSALLQQLLLAQGARYLSALHEQDWKQSAVLMELQAAEETGRTLPAGRWLLLPWDVGEASDLESWLGELHASGMRPDQIALITSMAHVRPDYLFALGARFDTRIVALQSHTGGLIGPPDLMDPLSVLFEPQIEEHLAWVNPLQHMVQLGDSRDPEVFSERLRRASPQIWATWTFIAINAVVYLIMLAEVGLDDFSTEQFLRFGANFAPLTVGEGQWWRLLSCTFVHAGLLHAGFNLYALKVLGEAAERLFGASMFAAIYLLAGLGGSIASLGWTLHTSPPIPSLGASGAVFGIMGAVLAYALVRRNTVPPKVFKGLTRSALIFIAINVTIGLSVSFIDNAAHLGGLFTGLVAGALLSRDLPPAPQPSGRQRTLMIALIGLGLMLILKLVADSFDAETLQGGLRGLGAPL